MIKFHYKIWIVSAVFFLLSGCASNQTAQSSASANTNNISAADINAQLGIAYLGRGDVGRAKEKLLLAQSQAPNNPVVWYAMGYFNEKTGDMAQANRNYLKAIKIAPNDGSAQNNYGTFLCRHGQYQPAISHFMIAIKDPNYLPVGEAYENAGLCALKIPNQALAQQYFIKALQYNPRLPKSLIHMAEMSYNQGNYRAAAGYLQRFHSLMPMTSQSRELQHKLALRK